jgi:hypothetical protein
LKYFTYHLVPVLASNYKQQNLSLTEVKMWVIHKLDFVPNMFIYFGGGGVSFMKRFKGDASYKSLGTSGLHRLHLVTAEKTK